MYVCDDGNGARLSKAITATLWLLFLCVHIFSVFRDRGMVNGGKSVCIELSFQFIAQRVRSLQIICLFVYYSVCSVASLFSFFAVSVMGSASRELTPLHGTPLRRSGPGSCVCVCVSVVQRAGADRRGDGLVGGVKLLLLPVVSAGMVFMHCTCV